MTGKRTFYLIAAIIGAVLPYVFFVTHFWYDGFALGTFLRAVFVNPAAGGFAADLPADQHALFHKMLTEGLGWTEARKQLKLPQSTENALRNRINIFAKRAASG